MQEASQAKINMPKQFVFQRIYMKLHTRPVTAAEFNLEGDMVVTASHDGFVGIWCAITGELLHTLGKFSAAVRAVSFSPDGKYVVIGQMASEFYIFDALTGKQLLAQCLPEGEKGVRFVQFSDDCATLYVVTLNLAQRYQIIQYAFADNKLVVRTVSQQLDGIAQSCLVHLDNMLISCDDGRLVNFDLAKNEIANEEDFGDPAPDMTLWRNRYAVIPCANQKKVYFYDFAKEVYQIGTEFNVNSCAVHPTANFCVLAGGIDAKLVTTTQNSDETLITQFYALDTKEMIFEVRLHIGPTWRLRWSPDGLTLLSTSEDSGCCLIRFTREGFLE